MHAGSRDRWRNNNDMPHDQFDHPYYYRRGRHAAAIAAHLYGWPHVRERCEATARQHGLVLEVPDFPSWWFPGQTTLVVYRCPTI